MAVGSRSFEGDALAAVFTVSRRVVACADSGPQGTRIGAAMGAFDVPDRIPRYVVFDARALENGDAAWLDSGGD